MDSATSFSISPSAVYDTRPAKIDVTILPPPVSVVFVGISGFCGSEPFVVMIALGSPAEPVGSSPPLVQPESARAPAAARAMAATPILLIFNVPPVRCARGQDGSWPHCALVVRDYEPFTNKPSRDGNRYRCAT
jgi:hypothetical protein